MKKRLFVIYVFLFIFGLFFLTNCSNNRNTETGNLIDSARTIKVVQLEGSANVRDSKETVACFKGMNLYDGDVVDVLANSTLVVKFDEDKYVYLAENTTINIKSDGKDKFKTNIFVEKGKVLAEIQNKLGEDEEFFLSSNNSVMAVRGTTFGVEVIDKGTFFEIAYSVFRGVTELYAFDKKDGNIISGKLTDLSNTKLELTVPKAEILDKDEFNKELSNWLKDIDNKFNDESDANNKLNEVEIKVAELTKDEYQGAIDNTGNKEITYSTIVYNSNGYFGKYDGKEHKIEISVENPGAKVYYKGENSIEYVETNDFTYTEPGTYRVYYKIVCEGFDDKEDFEVIQISPLPMIVYNSSGYTGTYDGEAHKIEITPITEGAQVYYKGENSTEYVETNDFAYTEVGTYKVYYKIICDGYETKEGYEIIQISALATIVYSSSGYTGIHDVDAHKIEVTPITEGAQVYYKGENSTEYVETNDFAYTEPGTYKVYYKIVCDGYETKEGYEIIQILPLPAIVYSSSGYTGTYDGEVHKIAVTPTTDGANVYYKGEDSTEYVETNDFAYTEAGTYKVYYKIVCDGYETKEGYEIIQILPLPSIAYSSNGYTGTYDGEAHKIEVTPTTEGAQVYYKGENSTEYVETNDFAYTEAGTYKVYYKIICDGYVDAEGSEEIRISKANLNVEYTNSFITNTALIEGTPLSQVFDNVDFFDYVNITGAESDNTAILLSTFAYNGVLSEGKKKYEITVSLPDSIKNVYNSTSIEFEIESFPLIIESTATISTQNNYPELSLGDIASFNKYNGVDEASLFGNPTFKVGTTTLTSNDYNNITYTYNHITEGYYELQTGKNTVDVKIEFDDYEVNTSTYFYFYDTREENSITFNLDEVMIQTIDSNNYWFNTQDMNEEGNNYKISGVYLLSKFGIGSCYINLPTDIIDSNSANYTENNDFLFAKEEVSSVEFTIFPTATVKGATRKINVYFSKDAPINYPEYTITNLSFMPGEQINFVDSTYPVTYSLDNSSYTDNLTISESGTYKVYFKVGNDTILTSSEVITIVNSTIYSPNLSFISNNMNVLSDDNHSYLTYVSSGELEHVEVNIVTNTGETMSPLSEVYDIYTNIIKNSKYYDSNTMQELDVTITVSDRINGSANFSYKIECDGYDTISGDVVFNYSTNDGLITYGKYSTGSTIYNPIDLEISIQDVPVVYASELSISSEDGYINSCMYSKDNGVTWSSDLPSFDEVGEYTVYAIYSYTVNTVDNVLISVQNIKITE